ncbi:YdcF family protein [Aerococcus viridans]
MKGNNLVRLAGFFAGMGIAVGLVCMITISNLIVDEEPKVSDIIVVPEGASERAGEAVDLLEDGYSRSGKIIVSPLTQSNLDFYVGAGAPSDALINEANATSTYTNARNTLKMMQEMGYDSAIITSSDYHMLRTKMIYERQNRHYGFDLTYVATYHDVGGEEVTWWQANRQAGFKEIKKFWGYMFFLYHWVDED